jgi:hypothetical protein
MPWLNFSGFYLIDRLASKSLAAVPTNLLDWQMGSFHKFRINDPFNRGAFEHHPRDR